MPEYISNQSSSPRFLSPLDLAECPFKVDCRAFVLLGDDHRGIADAVSMWLKRRFLTLPPINAIELLHRAACCVAPVILVSDLDFGTRDACSTIRALSQQHPAIRIIAYSGYETEIAVDMALHAGADRFISKLEDLEVLESAVDDLMNVLSTGVLEQNVVLHNRSYPTGRTRRKRHDHGPLIKWLLAGGFKQKRIAQLLGVALTTVEYYCRRSRGTGGN